MASRVSAAVAIHPRTCTSARAVRSYLRDHVTTHRQSSGRGAVVAVLGCRYGYGNLCGVVRHRPLMEALGGAAVGAAPCLVFVRVPVERVFPSAVFLRTPRGGCPTQARGLEIAMLCVQGMHGPCAPGAERGIRDMPWCLPNQV